VQHNLFLQLATILPRRRRRRHQRCVAVGGTLQENIRAPVVLYASFSRCCAMNSPDPSLL